MCARKQTPRTVLTATVETSFIYFNKIIWRQTFRNSALFIIHSSFCILHFAFSILHYPLSPAATTFLQTHLSTHRPLFRFFAKKTEPKMPPLYSATRKQASAYALPGRSPYFRCAEVVGAFAPSDVQPSARQSATFCRFACVTKWGYAVCDCFPPARERSDIGGCDPSFIL